MKDTTRKTAESSRPDVSALQSISNSLEQIYADQEHNSSDDVVDGLKFEELIGALLQARDLAEQEDQKAQQDGPLNPV